MTCCILLKRFDSEQQYWRSKGKGCLTVNHELKHHLIKPYKTATTRTNPKCSPLCFQWLGLNHSRCCVCVCPKQNLKELQSWACLQGCGSLSWSLLLESDCSSVLLNYHVTLTKYAVSHSFQVAKDTLMVQQLVCVCQQRRELWEWCSWWWRKDDSKVKRRKKPGE